MERAHTRRKRLKDRFLGYSGCVSSAHHLNYRDTSKGARYTRGECRWRGPPRSDQLCLCRPSVPASSVAVCRVPGPLVALCRLPRSLCAVCRLPLQSLCAVCRLPTCLPHSLAEEPSSSSQSVRPYHQHQKLQTLWPLGILVTSVNPCVLCESLWPLWILVNLVWEWCKDLGFLASPTSVSAYIKLVKGSPSDRVNYLNVHSLDGFFYRFLCFECLHIKMDEKYLPHIDQKKFKTLLILSCRQNGISP